MGKRKHNYQWLREIFSESGRLSSKRVIGSLVLFVCMFCIVFLVVTEGGTQVVENLLQTTLIMSGALLGISSITRIWADKNKTPKE